MIRGCRLDYTDGDGRFRLVLGVFSGSFVLGHVDVEIKRGKEKENFTAVKAIDMGSSNEDALFRRFIIWERIWATEILGFHYKLQLGLRGSNWNG